MWDKVLFHIFFSLAKFQQSPSWLNKKYLQLLLQSQFSLTVILYYMITHLELANSKNFTLAHVDKTMLKIIVLTPTLSFLGSSLANNIIHHTPCINVKQINVRKLVNPLLIVTSYIMAYLEINDMPWGCAYLI